MNQAALSSAYQTRLGLHCQLDSEGQKLPGGAAAEAAELAALIRPSLSPWLPFLKEDPALLLSKLPFISFMTK